MIDDEILDCEMSNSKTEVFHVKCFDFIADYNIFQKRLILSDVLVAKNLRLLLRKS